MDRVAQTTGHVLALAALVLGSGASSLGAQRAPTPFLDVQSSTGDAAAGQSSGLAIAPGFTWQTARTSLWLRGASDVDGNALRLRSADGQVRTTLARVGRFDIGTGARAQHDELPDGARYSRVNADVRLTTGSAVRGLSLGAGVLASSAPNARFATPTARVGGWFRSLGLSVSGEVVTGRAPVGMSGDSTNTTWLDSTWVAPPIDSGGAGHWSYSHPSNGIPTKSGLTSEARVAMYTRVAGLDVQGDAGMFLFQRGAPARSYGTVTVTRWMSSQLAAVIGGGVRTLDPTFGAKKPMAILGLRFAPGRVAPHLVDAPPASATGMAVSRSGGDVTIRLRAPGATSVELAGDFTKWNAMPLARRSGDYWALTVPLKPGVYRLQVRIDEGEWAPPPGASRAVDPYEGSVGVLVIS